MSRNKQVQERRKLFLSKYGQYPGAEEKVDRYEALAENPEYLRHLNNILAYQQGLDPIPDRNGHEDLLRAVGHDFAAMDALPPGSPLRDLLLPGPSQENYLTLFAIIAARLMEEPAPLSDRQIVALYDTLDRMMRGGGSWLEVTRVRTVTFYDYHRLRPLRFQKTLHPVWLLGRILEFKVRETHGQKYKPLFMIVYGALELIAFMVTARTGGRRVSTEDSFEAADAYAKLFEIDPMALPPLVREGQSGYERVLVDGGSG